MKKSAILNISMILALSGTCCSNVYAQDSTTYQTASDRYGSGVFYFTQKQYQRAIENFRASNDAIPSALVYYFLGLSYNELKDPRDAYDAMTAALSFRPALANKFNSTAQDIKSKSWYAVQNGHYQVFVGGDALTVLPARPTAQDNPYTLKKPVQFHPTYVSPSPVLNDRILNNRIILPGGGTENNNGYIGDFCCTGETATVLRSDNSPVGYIYFYGFDGGMNLGNNKSAASKLIILLSAEPNIDDVSGTRIKDQIEFSGANELREGAVKTKTVGALNYMISILSVHKYTDTSFYMDEISIRVDIIK